MTKLRVWTFAFLAFPLLFVSCTAKAALPPASETGAAKLYGTTEVFSRNLAQFPHWTDMIGRAAAELGANRVCASSGDTGCAPRKWRDLIESVKNLPAMAKLEAVNAAINRHPYVPTQQNWHKNMYWETPFQFLAKGGQCQDYAIAKYLALKAAGMGDDQLRMLVLHIDTLGLDHAVLVATIGGTAYILDNLNPKILPASQVPQYRPYYAINASGYWFLTGGHGMLASGYGR